MPSKIILKIITVILKEQSQIFHIEDTLVIHVYSLTILKVNQLMDIKNQKNQGLGKESSFLQEANGYTFVLIFIMITTLRKYIYA